MLSLNTVLSVFLILSPTAFLLASKEADSAVCWLLLWFLSVSILWTPMAWVKGSEENSWAIASESVELSPSPCCYWKMHTKEEPRQDPLSPGDEDTPENLKLLRIYEGPRVTRQSIKKDTSSKRTWNTCRGSPLTVSRVLTCTCMWRNCLRLREESQFTEYSAEGLDGFCLSGKQYWP